MTRARATLAAAAIADLLGAAGVLLFAGRDWQRVVVSRARPLPDAVAELNGRDLQAAMTAFALIALAGVVAIAATRGWGRRLVGVVLAAAGAITAWLALTGLSAVSPARARASVSSGVGVDASSVPTITVDAVWPVLTAISAALIVLAGVLTALDAARWSGLSSRYEAPVGAASAAQEDRAKGDIALWSALDRGDDPTTRTES